MSLIKSLIAFDKAGKGSLCDKHCVLLTAPEDLAPLWDSLPAFLLLHQIKDA